MFQITLSCLYLLFLLPLARALINDPIAHIEGSRIAHYGRPLILNCVAKNASQYTIYESTNAQCRPVKPLTKYIVNVSRDRLTVNIASPPKSYFGTKRFFCALKTNTSVGFGCHSVTIGRVPELPKKTGCVILDFKKLSCKITPSPDELIRRTMMDRVSENFRIEYTLLYRRNGGELDKNKCCAHSCKCQVSKDSSGLTYDIPLSQNINDYTLRIRTSNVLGFKERNYEHRYCDTAKLTLSVKRVNVTRNSFAFTWSTVDPPVHFYSYRLEVLCKGSNPFDDFVNETYAYIEETSDSRPPTVFNNLHPGMKYRCSIRVRFNVSGCIGYWSESKFLEFTTLESEPSAPPEVEAGMVRRTGEKFYFYIQPITPELRNGKVTNYRIVIGSSNFSSQTLDFTVPGSDVGSSDFSVSGKTSAGWGEKGTIPFSKETNIFMNSELELWATTTPGYYLSDHRIANRPSRCNQTTIENQSFLICYCGSSCEANPHCTDLREVSMNDSQPLKIDFKKERVASFVRYTDRSCNFMSNWVGCEYEKEGKRPYSKKPKPYPDGNVLNHLPNTRYYLLDHSQFGCSPYMRLPVYKIIVRTSCNDSKAEDREWKRNYGDVFKFSVSIKDLYKSCEILLSYDGKTFYSIEKVPAQERSYELYYVIAIFAILVVGFAIFSILKFKKKIINKLRAICRHMRQNPPPQTILPTHGSDSSRSYIDQGTPLTQITDNASNGTCNGAINGTSIRITPNPLDGTESGVTDNGTGHYIPHELPKV